MEIEIKPINIDTHNEHTPTKTHTLTPMQLQEQVRH